MVTYLSPEAGGSGGGEGGGNGAASGGSTARVGGGCSGGDVVFVLPRDRRNRWQRRRVAERQQRQELPLRTKRGGSITRTAEIILERQILQVVWAHDSSNGLVMSKSDTSSLHIVREAAHATPAIGRSKQSHLYNGVGHVLRSLQLGPCVPRRLKTTHGV